MNDYYLMYKSIGLDYKGAPVCFNCEEPLMHVFHGGKGGTTVKCRKCDQVSYVNIETMEVVSSPPMKKIPLKKRNKSKKEK